MTLWSGRLGGGLADEMAAFTTSLSFDRQLWRVDLEGSRAHVTGLGAAGLLSGAEVLELHAALAEVARELDGDTFEFLVTDEDIHTAVERRVTELVGSTGAKLHTGRSRNDQIATDLRLWTRRATAMLAGAVVDLATTLHEAADRAADAYLPGYTHLQRAQPVLLSHHLRAHAWSLLRDADRLFDAAGRADVSPLGAGALAGSSLPLDPEVAARELGFAATFHNSLDAVSDRDFVAELLFCAALCGVHLSRMGEELVLWTSAEFGFCELDDRFTTGSSMLPQKKNPDVLELVRGRSGRPIAALMGILTVLKGLPLSYDRDLQEDRGHLFGAVASVQDSVEVLSGLLGAIQFNRKRMADAASDPVLLATDLAEWLVRGGVPFRLAHGMVARIVREAESRHLGLDQVVRQSWRRLGFSSAAEAERLFRPERSLAQREQPGSPGPKPTAAALSAAAERVAAHRSWARALARRLPA